MATDAVQVVKAPYPFAQAMRPWLFLGGSIEMGKAEDWQTRLTAQLVAAGWKGTILNPRRDDWDDSWVQSIDDPRFRQQVEWELIAQDAAQQRIYYFSPGTNAPITLLELGLYIHKRPIVCCPREFYRRGNVEIVCRHHDVRIFDTLADAVEELLKVKGRAG